MLAASSQGRPPDKNICALLEWVKPNEELLAQDRTHSSCACLQCVEFGLLIHTWICLETVSRKMICVDR